MYRCKGGVEETGCRQILQRDKLGILTSLDRRASLKKQHLRNKPKQIFVSIPTEKNKQEDAYNKLYCQPCSLSIT